MREVDRAHRRRLRLPRVQGRPTAPATVCGHAAIAGHARRHRHQQRPARSGRRHQGHALHPVHAASSALPIVYLQNTTGYIVGKRGRARRHDQARLEDDPGAVATPPCRRSRSSAAPRSAPATTACAAAASRRASSSAGRRAKTAVMGAEQAAGTMEIVMREGAARKGEPRRRGEARSAAGDKIVADVRAPGRRLLHLGPAARRRRHRPARHAPRARPRLAVCDEAARRTLRPMQFGVARPVAAPAEPGDDHAVHPRARGDPAHAEALHRRGDQSARRRMGGGRGVSRRTRCSSASASSACSA